MLLIYAICVVLGAMALFLPVSGQLVAFVALTGVTGLVFFVLTRRSVDQARRGGPEPTMEPMTEPPTEPSAGPNTAAQATPSATSSVPATPATPVTMASSASATASADEPTPQEAASL